MDNEKLVQMIQSGINTKAAAEQLYNQNIRLLQSLCKPYSYYAEIDDLMQEAYIALINAAHSYNAGKNVKFTTYAVKAIRRHCARYIKDNGNIKRIPEYMLRLISEYDNFINDMLTAYGREPTKAEIMNGLKLSERQYFAMITAKNGLRIISLDDTIKDSDTPIYDIIPDNTDIEDDYIDKECKHGLWEHVSALPDQERCIIKSRYKDNLTYEQIAQNEENTKSRIRAAEQKGLRTLSHNRGVKDIAERYGYGIRQAYKWSLGRFKNTWTSSVEWIALNRVEPNPKLD